MVYVLFVLTVSIVAAFIFLLGDRSQIEWWKTTSLLPEEKEEETQRMIRKNRYRAWSKWTSSIRYWKHHGAELAGSSTGNRESCSINKEVALLAPYRSHEKNRAKVIFTARESDQRTLPYDRLSPIDRKVRFLGGTKTLDDLKHLNLALIEIRWRALYKVYSCINYVLAFSVHWAVAIRVPFANEMMIPAELINLTCSLQWVSMAAAI